LARIIIAAKPSTTHVEQLKSASNKLKTSERVETVNCYHICYDMPVNLDVRFEKIFKMKE